MKILFISATRIGDAVLTMGALSWLQTTYPQAKITVACGPAAQDLFRALPNLDQIIVLHKKRGHAHWLALWKRCAFTRWDIIVDLRNSLVSRFLYAHKKHIKRNQPFGGHKTDEIAKVLNLAAPPPPKIWIDQKAQANADRLVDPTGSILALGPAANWPPKQWDLTNFIKVSKCLLEQDGPLPRTRLMVVAAPNERAHIEPLLKAFPSAQIIDLIGNDLLTVAACLQKASLFIGNDSGLMHMAAAMGTPTLGLFGPSDEQVYGPYGPRTSTVRTLESKEDLLARIPSPEARSPCLMNSLTVEHVLAAAKDLLQDSQFNHRKTISKSL